MANVNAVTPRLRAAIGSISRTVLFYLRTLRDAEALSDAIKQSRNLVVIGAGFIGLEIAASAANRGSQVDVIDVADRLLVRAVSKEMTSAIRFLHEARGIRFHLNQSLRSLSDSLNADRT